VYAPHVARHLLVPSALLLACASSAPYTLPAAAINTGLALGVAAGQRAAGGCYAVCTHGTVCNEKTGLCVAATADSVCEEGPGGGMRCVPLQIGAKEERTGAVPPLGISPATGTVPPPPSESTPRDRP